MRHILRILFLLCVTVVVSAQTYTIQGHFPQLNGVDMRLVGYDGFQTQELSHAASDSTGKFLLSYPTDYQGAAVLQIKEGPGVIVLLNGENFSVHWHNVEDFSTLSFSGSVENDLFAKGIALNQQAEQKIAGLNYLLPQYESAPKKARWLSQELVLQQKQFADYLTSLPSKSYAAYYLNLRKFATDIAQAIKQNDGDYLSVESQLKALQLNDRRLWHSGLLGDVLSGSYQLMAASADTARVNGLSAIWLRGLSVNSTKQQEVAEYCFKLLERQNLTSASAYIATSMLNESACQLDAKRTDLFEQYRKMAIGSTAPDIVLHDGTKLSDLRHTYVLVVFGASWCANCQTDYPALSGVYGRSKVAHDLECVYISLDTDLKAYESFYKEAPFITFCDGKGWASVPVIDYHVFATPSYFLLDSHLKIVAKPTTPENLDYFLTTNYK